MTTILLTTDQIKEIAGWMDCGMNCHLHKGTREMIFLTDEYNYFGDLEDDESDPEFEEPWDADRRKIYENLNDYLAIEKMESRESFHVMESFVETVDSLVLRNRLIGALEQNKPFSKFKYIIDNSGDYREQWFAFKGERTRGWVKEQIDAYNLGLTNGNDEE